MFLSDVFGQYFLGLLSEMFKRDYKIEHSLILMHNFLAIRRQSSTITWH